MVEAYESLNVMIPNSPNMNGAYDKREEQPNLYPPHEAPLRVMKSSKVTNLMLI